MRFVCSGDNHYPSCAKLTSTMKFVGTDGVLCCGTSESSETDLLMGNGKIKSLPDNLNLKQMYSFIEKIHELKN